MVSLDPDLSPNWFSQRIYTHPLHRERNLWRWNYLPVSAQWRRRCGFWSVWMVRWPAAFSCELVNHGYHLPLHQKSGGRVDRLSVSDGKVCELWGVVVKDGRSPKLDYSPLLSAGQPPPASWLRGDWRVHSLPLLYTGDLFLFTCLFSLILFFLLYSSPFTLSPAAPILGLVLACEMLSPSGDPQDQRRGRKSTSFNHTT